MPDCKNKVSIGFPDQKYLKSGIIHTWAEGGPSFGFPQNGGPLGGTTLCAQQNQNSRASNRRNNAKFNSQMQKIDTK